MHKASSYIKTIIPNKNNVTIRPLNASEANSLEMALIEDACDYYYSAACISIIDAIRGVESNFFSWSTIKLYYTVFYSLRSFLAANGHGLIYYNRTPFYFFARPGKTGMKKRGNTHQVILKLFKDNYPNHYLLSQSIELENPLDWMMNHRNDTNYKIPRFPEPSPAAHFENIKSKTIRRVVEYFYNDDTGVYIFDPDYAIFTFPLKCLSESMEQIKQIKDPFLKDKDSDYLARVCKDKSGRFARLSHLFN